MSQLLDELTIQIGQRSGDTVKTIRALKELSIILFKLHDKKRPRKIDQCIDNTADSLEDDLGGMLNLNEIADVLDLIRTKEKPVRKRMQVKKMLAFIMQKALLRNELMYELSEMNSNQFRSNDKLSDMNSNQFGSNDKLSDMNFNQRYYNKFPQDNWKNKLNFILKSFLRDNISADDLFPNNARSHDSLSNNIPANDSLPNNARSHDSLSNNTRADGPLPNNTRTHDSLSNNVRAHDPLPNNGSHDPVRNGVFGNNNTGVYNFCSNNTRADGPLPNNTRTHDSLSNNIPANDSFRNGAFSSNTRSHDSLSNNIPANDSFRNGAFGNNNTRADGPIPNNARSHDPNNSYKNDALGIKHTKNEAEFETNPVNRSTLKQVTQHKHDKSAAFLYKQTTRIIQGEFNLTYKIAHQVRDVNLHQDRVAQAPTQETSKAQAPKTQVEAQEAQTTIQKVPKAQTPTQEIPDAQPLMQETSSAQVEIQASPKAQVEPQETSKTQVEIQASPKAQVEAQETSKTQATIQETSKAQAPTQSTPKIEILRPHNLNASNAGPLSSKMPTHSTSKIPTYSDITFLDSKRNHQRKKRHWKLHKKTRVYKVSRSG